MTHPALAAAVTAAREFADAMEKAHAALAPEPEPTPTRVEIVTTDDDARLVGAEPGIPGEGSAYLWATSYGTRTSLWLSRDEARQLAATLTAIADTP